MDWDGDGRLDLILGDRPGNVHYFRRLEYGSIYLEEQELIEVAGRPIDVGYNSAPCVTDWNGDGLPDLVVGNLSPIPAGIFLFVNQGEPFLPEYIQVDTVFCQGEPVEITTAYPDMHDMDLDGLEDLVVGSSNGKIACFINRGTPQQPVFDGMEYLRADGEEIYICSYVRPSVCDWNSDGIPDLLVGDYTGQIHLFTGEQPSGIEVCGELSANLTGNPVSGSASVRIDLPWTCEVSTMLFSLDGRFLHEIRHGVHQAGSSSVCLDTSFLENGVYLLLVKAGNWERSLQLVIIR